MVIGPSELPKLVTIGTRTPSEHFDGRFERTVLVNDAASAYERLTATTVIPQGALVVQRHHPAGSDSVAVYYVMEKVAANPGGPGSPAKEQWKFFIVDEALRVAGRDVALCARCHAEAPFDGLFGIGKRERTFNDSVVSLDLSDREH